MDKYKKVIVVLGAVMCAYLIILGTWVAFIKNNSNPIDLRARVSGIETSYTHTETTPEGDLWIYNSINREIMFVENPKNTGEMKVYTKDVSRNANDR